MDPDRHGGPRDDIAGAPAVLEGVSVAVTRAEEHGEGLGPLLEAMGAAVLSTPVMRIVPPADALSLRGAAEGLAEFDWVVLGSGNAALALMEACRSAGTAPASGPRADPEGERSGPRVCAVGPSTRSVLEAGGWTVHLIPDRFLGSAVVEALAARGELRGRRVLLPRVAGGPRALPDALRRGGARVEEVEAYRNVPDREGLERLRKAVREGRVDVIALAAGSAARRVHEALSGDTGRARVAVIGPATEEVAVACGLRVDAVADPHTARGLAEACVRALRAEAGSRSGKRPPTPEG